MNPPIQHILVPTDFSERSQVALSAAGRIAQEEGAVISLLHSIRLPILHTPYDVNVPEAIWEGLRKGTRIRMREAQLFLNQAGCEEVQSVISESLPPHEAIAKCAEETQTDLIVMATHGRRGVSHAFLGSVCEKTLRLASPPVLAIKDPPDMTFPPRRILCPIDFSDSSDRARRLGEAWAGRYGAQIVFLHVIESSPDVLRYGSADGFQIDQACQRFSEEQLESRVQAAQEIGLDADACVARGIAHDVIVEQAALLDADLIVMGTHGFSGLQHAVLGSVTERTLRLSRRPILVT